MRSNPWLLGGCTLLALLASRISSPARAADLQGEIKVDGSSTVYLITEAAAAAFKKLYPDVRITVGISGTGGGFKKFAAGETDISDASRTIRPQETAACKANGIEFLEHQVAWDGLAVVVHPANDWARRLTVQQLHKIWRPNDPATKWSDVDPSWPGEAIKLFGAGRDSGTFDYFTEAINGKEKVCRTDYEATEDDNVTVRGVAGNKYALGFFGLAYYETNKDKLGLVAIAPSEGADHVAPTRDSVLDGTYKPLSRPLFIYVKRSSLERPEVREFLRFFLRRDDLVESANYIRLSLRQSRAQKRKLDAAVKSLR